jgi:hypothetical protein
MPGKRLNGVVCITWNKRRQENNDPNSIKLHMIFKSVNVLNTLLGTTFIYEATATRLGVAAAQFSIATYPEAQTCKKYALAHANL